MKYLKNILIWTIISAVSLFIALVLFEVIIQNMKAEKNIIRVAASAYGSFDKETGIHYEPNSTVSFAYINSKGKICDCLENVSVTNKDGLRGNDGYEQYGKAEHKIIVSGDSYSHWNIGGKTIVDLTKDNLVKQGFDVSLLNVAGGTFGLQHMVVNISALLNKDNLPDPSLIVIQFIRDDITRDWWYMKSLTDENGFQRTRIARNEDCLSVESGCGADEYLVNASATKSWCSEQKGNLNPDSVSEALIKQYNDIRGFFIYIPKLLAQYSLINPAKTSVIPRLQSVDEIDKKRLTESVKKIRQSKAKVLLLLLPVKSEIVDNKIELTEQEKSILNYYENELNTMVVYPEEFTDFLQVKNFEVSVYDGHPSGELQEAYGMYISKVISNIIE